MKGASPANAVDRVLGPTAPEPATQSPPIRVTPAWRISVEGSRAFSHRYSLARMISSVANTPLPITRPTPELRIQPDCDRRPIALSREPCRRCQVRGDLGCEHQAPCAAVEIEPFRLTVDGRRIHARHLK